MGAYYNEHDRFAAAWLRELIGEGLIPAGHVDERDIRDVQPADLAGYDQHHFFAGIGGWALALQIAGWDGPVWTGSCPCQPFSSAGRGQGFEDPRHLWPTWFRLIRECRPPVVFGEQVASADGLAWLDTVSTDLEAEDYAFGAADLCAAGVGAPHIRQRLFFVAHATKDGLREQEHARAVVCAPGSQSGNERQLPPDRSLRGGAVGAVAHHSITGRRAQPERPAGEDGRSPEEPRRLRDAGAVANASGPRPAWSEQRGADRGAEGEGLRLVEPERDGAPCPVADAAGDRREEHGRGLGHEQPESLTSNCGGLGDAGGPGLQGHQQQALPRAGDQRHELRGAAPEPDSAPWSDLLWLPCRDGKARPAESSIQPLAHGVPNRVGTLRGAGNAIVPQVAAEFIRAYQEVSA